MNVMWSRKLSFGCENSGVKQYTKEVELSKYFYKSYMIKVSLK